MSSAKSFTFFIDIPEDVQLYYGEKAECGVVKLVKSTWKLFRKEHHFPEALNPICAYAPHDGSTAFKFIEHRQGLLEWMRAFEYPKADQIQIGSLKHYRVFAIKTADYNELSKFECEMSRQLEAPALSSAIRLFTFEHAEELSSVLESFYSSRVVVQNGTQLVHVGSKFANQSASISTPFALDCLASKHIVYIFGCPLGMSEDVQKELEMMTHPCVQQVHPSDRQLIASRIFETHHIYNKSTRTVLHSLFNPTIKVFEQFLLDMVCNSTNRVYQVYLMGQGSEQGELLLADGWYRGTQLKKLLLDHTTSIKMVLAISYALEFIRSMVTFEALSDTLCLKAICKNLLNVREDAQMTALLRQDYHKVKLPAAIDWSMIEACILELGINRLEYQKAPMEFIPFSVKETKILHMLCDMQAESSVPGSRRSSRRLSGLFEKTAILSRVQTMLAKDSVYLQSLSESIQTQCRAIQTASPKAFYKDPQHFSHTFPRLTFYGMEHGECCLLQYKDVNLLINGGPSPAPFSNQTELPCFFADLVPLLHLDVLVTSYDVAHVNGILMLLGAAKSGFMDIQSLQAPFANTPTETEILDGFQSFIETSNGLRNTNCQVYTVTAEPLSVWVCCKDLNQEWHMLFCGKASGQAVLEGVEQVCMTLGFESIKQVKFDLVVLPSQGHPAFEPEYVLQLKSKHVVVTGDYASALQTANQTWHHVGTSKTVIVLEQNPPSTIVSPMQSPVTSKKVRAVTVRKARPAKPQ